MVQRKVFPIIYHQHSSGKRIASHIKEADGNLIRISYVDHSSKMDAVVDISEEKEVNRFNNIAETDTKVIGNHDSQYQLGDLIDIHCSYPCAFIGWYPAKIIRIELDQMLCRFYPFPDADNKMKADHFWVSGHNTDETAPYQMKNMLYNGYTRNFDPIQFEKYVSNRRDESLEFMLEDISLRRDIEDRRLNGNLQIQSVNQRDEDLVEFDVDGLDFPFFVDIGDNQSDIENTEQSVQRNDDRHSNRKRKRSAQSNEDAPPNKRPKVSVDYNVEDKVDCNPKTFSGGWRPGQIVRKDGCAVLIRFGVMTDERKGMNVGRRCKEWMQSDDDSQVAKYRTHHESYFANTGASRRKQNVPIEGAEGNDMDRVVTEFETDSQHQIRSTSNAVAGSGSQTTVDSPYADNVDDTPSRGLQNQSISEDSGEIKKQYHCSECGKSYVKKVALHEHIGIEHHGIRHRCLEPGCGVIVKHRGSLRNHYKNIHQGMKNPPVDRTRFVLDTDGPSVAIFNSPQQIQSISNLEESSSERKSAAAIQSMAEDQEDAPSLTDCSRSNVSSNTRRRYRCSECGKRYVRKCTLVQHIGIEHRGIRQRCLEPNCNKVVRFIASLYEHYKSVHPGTKYPDVKQTRFVPDIQQTSVNNFHSTGSRRGHRVPKSSKISNPMSQCGLCSKKIKKWSVERHLDAIHRGVVFNCYCGREFKHYSTLFYHYKREHPDEKCPKETTERAKARKAAKARHEAMDRENADQN